MNHLKNVTLNGVPLNPDEKLDQEKPDQEIMEVRQTDESRKPKKNYNHKKWKDGRRKVLGQKIFTPAEIERANIKREYTNPDSGFMEFKLSPNITAILRPDGIDIQIR